ncbi:MAG: co-chaperone GroES [Terriglobia bacterium]
MAYLDGDCNVVAEINNKPFALNLEALNPTDDGVLVRVLPKRYVIFLGKEDYQIGEVVAVGPGKRGKRGSRIPLDVKPGDVVAFGNFHKAEYKDYVLISEGQILVVLGAGGAS